MLSISREVDKLIRVLRRTAPDTIYSGKLIKINKSIDPATNLVAEITSEQSIEIINDQLTQDEINGTTILSSDFKIHVIARKGIYVDFYDVIECDFEAFLGRKLRIVKKVTFVEGSKNLLYTLVVRLQ